MLVVKRLAGVASEGTLRNTFYADDKTCKEGMYHGFETQYRQHQRYQTVASVAPTKATDVLQFF